MNLKTPFELQIYWKNDQACQLEELGISVTIEETQPIMFYSVDIVSKGTIEGSDKEIGYIGVGGEEYATTLSYEELNELVMKNMG